ncbi:MAG: FAD-binding oxidoreductase [Myxococcales bacterium]|nr:FAD-binding oxidoreductase [Myxococcales bacterium]
MAQMATRLGVAALAVLGLGAAARAQPALKTYYGRLPRAMSHYGGFYTMTQENWPLVGPMGVEGAFVAGAFSGFGTMAACAAGELCAAWVLGEAPTDDAVALSPMRFEGAALMAGLRGQASRGIL